MNLSEMSEELGRTKALPLNEAVHKSDGAVKIIGSSLFGDAYVSVASENRSERFALD